MKQCLKKFLMYYFFPYYQFDLDNTLIFFLAGRYEYHDKGIDTIRAQGLCQSGDLFDLIEIASVNRCIDLKSHTRLFGKLRSLYHGIKGTGRPAKCVMLSFSGAIER